MRSAKGNVSTVHVLRLEPGEDVRPFLEKWALDNGIEAAAVTSAVGSLTVAHIRYAGRADGIVTSSDLEVCSFSGTLAKYGVHLHVSVADRDGAMLGGHMLPGCLVRTTLEIVIQEIGNMRMLRTKDEQTTYDELDPRIIAP